MYIDTQLAINSPSVAARMYDCHKTWSGGYICGELKLAITLRIMGGGQYVNVAPYDNAAPGSAEDSFNYFQSASRIYVECAFGEITMRWGFFGHH